uniref:Leucine rich repeat containing 9 n=1 Tax=Hippocampus comes TaxID=109280 RepID=A0A3Q2YGE2_HIPCM
HCTSFCDSINISFIPQQCMANGLSYDDLAEEVSNVTSLEIILSGFPRMVGLSFFPMLRQLQILGQDIKRIEGLESCPLLQELWVVECKLTKISGLQHCPDLKKLYLYDNKITEIKNLKFLVNIEVLWLNNNYISQIQPYLSILLLSVYSCLCLTKIVTDLALSDFTSTPNPLCLLCNYATHVMFHLPLLLFLDTYDVSSTQINEVAESAVMKKMMFYNMRVRIPRRNLKETLLRLLKKKNASLESPKESIRSLNYTLKNVGTPPENLSTKGDSCDPSAEQILRKIEVLQQRLAIWTRRLHDIESWHQHNVSQATETMEDSVHFMSTELQSVGNIRMEEGSSTDPWFTSCCDLLLSRFSLSDFMSHGITGIKINRVVRIHNSGLRLRFKDKLQSLLAREDSVTLAQNYKQQLEHLFYVGDSDQNREDVLSILEEGFKSAKEYKHAKFLMVFSAQNRPLEKKVYPRAASVYRNGLHTTIPKGRKWFVFDNELVLPEYMICFEYLTGVSGSISIGSLFLSDPQAVNMEPVLEPQPKLGNLNETVLLNVSGVLNLHNNGLSSLKGIPPLPALRHLTLSFNELTSLNHFAHMPNLEFLDVSFNQLVSLEGLQELKQLTHLDLSWNQLTNAGDVSTVLKIHTPALQILETQHNPWNKVSVMKLRKLDNTLVAEEEVANAVHKTTRTVLTQEILIACSHTNDERPRSLSLVSTTQLLSELIPPPRDLSPDLQPDWASKITSLNLDNQKICQMSHLDALVNLRWASFNNNYISEVEGLDFCTNLEELSLNNNNISTLSGLSHLQNLSKLSMDGNQLSNFDAIVLDQLHSLTFLSVENNLITSLHGIHRCSALLELYAGNNHISVSRDIYYLKVLENLIILDLYGNPLAENLKNYRIYVVFHLPNLKALDGSECENAKAMFGGRLTPDLVAEKLGHSHYSSITYLTVNSCSIRSVDLSPIDLFFNVHTINLDHNNLTCFSGLIHLPNVKVQTRAMT